MIKELEGINKNIAKKLKMLFPVLRSIIIEITLDSQYQKVKIILAIQVYKQMDKKTYKYRKM